MKPKVKKILKIGAITLSTATFVGLTIFVSRSWNNIQTISVGGSSAVMPLMNSLSSIYQDADIVTSSGGSGAGINSILQNTKEIGMASKNPGIIELGEDNSKYKKWNEINAKTITIAWDGIALVYKPSSNQEPTIDLNNENFAKLYTAFSGVKKLTLGDFLKDEKITTNVIPYARSGGSSISGTADAFWKDSHSDFKNSNYWTNLSQNEKETIEENLEKGNYGSHVYETAESNKQSWDRIKNAPAGSMIYLSAGFVLNNKKEIENHGFKIATYNGVELKEDTISTTYKWYRPFNLMMSLNRINNEIKKMINWIIFDKKAKEVIKNDGFIVLNDEQIKSMIRNGKDLDINIIKNENKLFDLDSTDIKIGHSGAKG